jgi:hypothetical protein
MATTLNTYSDVIPSMGGRTASEMEEVLGEEVESTFGASRLPRRSTFYGRVLRETLLKFY